jgi:crotonobetainyl-CoA:carnitine CoA-transferase CaiB-like acyl-CoA transferase
MRPSILMSLRRASSLSGDSVARLIGAFWAHAKDYYRGHEGERSGELENFRAALHWLRRLYQDTAVTDFWPLALKAIRAADLGLNPSNDGKLVRIPIPPLTEERRKQLAKQVHDIAEDHRTATRNVRRDANDRLKKMLKDKLISEDAEHDALDEIQKLTNNYIGKIDELSKSNEQEIMSV